MSILEGLIRGTGQASNFMGAQQQRRLAAEQGAREQSNFEQGQRNQQLSDIYSRGRTEGYIMADPEEGQIQLSDTFKERLADGDQLAQNYAAEIFNAGGRGKLPEGFKIDRINRGTDPDGNAVFFVGGINADGSKGVITTDGTSNDDSAAKAFTLDELFNQTKLAFRSKEGVLYGQRVVDLNDYANSRDLILSNTQNRILDGLGSNPAAQRQASAVIANAATPEEEVEVTNLLAESVGVPPVQLPATATSEPEPEPESEPEATPTPAAKPAPKDNSAQIAKLEKELATIEGRKTGTSRANVRAAERKRAEIQRLKDESEPEGEGIMSKVLAAQNRTFGGSPIPAKVEQVIAPVVEDKTIAEIDEAVDNGDLQIDQETAAAAAKDLQEQGVETAADLAKLDPRRQAFAYAMIVASTPNDGNRRAVRDQLINILETGVSDRGAEDRQQARLDLDYQQFARSLFNDRQRINETNNEFAQDMYKELQANFDEDGNLTTSRGDIFQLANEYLPRIQQQATIATTDESRAAINRLGNTTLSLVMQQMAASGDYGTAVDSFLKLFRPGVNGQISANLSGISTDGEMIFYGVRSGSGTRRQDEGVKISELRKLNSDVANLLVNIANSNEAARGNSG